VEIPRTALKEGYGLLAAYVAAGLVASNGEARRNLQAGAVRVNDRVIEDDRAMLTEADLLPEGVIKLSLGKKKHALIRPA
jgi:tyrosyl-tRNA synthetase